MNIGLVKKWIHELRTTEKKQCRGLLHRLQTDNQSEGFCCVGIACEVALDDGLSISRKRDFESEAYDFQYLTAPESVENYYKIPPGFFSYGMGFNDRVMLSFAEIADRYEWMLNKYPTWDIPMEQDAESINKEYLEWMQTQS